MPRNDEGEFELILGNKQLLSVFFLIVILLGVFFTLGYVVGRSSGPLGAVDTASAKKSGESGSSQAPLVIDSGSSAKQADTGSSKSGDPVKSEPNGSAATASSARADRRPSPVHDETPPDRKEEAAPARRPEPETTRSGPARVSYTEPQVGQTYLQLAATAKPEAELLADVVAKKGFHIVVTPAPNTKLYRVLVGPLRDAAQTSRTKADLEELGFKSIVQRYR